MGYYLTEPVTDQAAETKAATMPSRTAVPVPCVAETRIGTHFRNCVLSTKSLDAETGLYYYGHRFYNPEIGRWASRDPLGEWSVLARMLKSAYARVYRLHSRLKQLPDYNFVRNAPVDHGDVLGLFAEGMPNREAWEHDPKANPRDYRPPGHGDFPGSDVFNYNAEDTDPATRPTTAPDRHFRPLDQSQREVDDAIRRCDKNSFERAMHRGQDYFSHYRPGYRWEPGNFRCRQAGLGHVLSYLPCVGSPDDNEEAWSDAYSWTGDQLDAWSAKCCKCGDGWRVRSAGPCDREVQ